MEIIGYVYKELKGSLVDTVRSEDIKPVNVICLSAYGDVCVKSSVNTDFICKVLGTPSTEVKRNRLIVNWVSSKNMKYVNATTFESIRRKYGVIHKTETEKVKELKTIVYNARDFASKLEQLNGFLEKTANNYVCETCRDAASMLRVIADSLAKYCK